MKKTKYFKAYLDDMYQVNIYLALNNYDGVSKSFYIESEDHEQIPLVIVDDIIVEGYHKYECKFEKSIEFGKQYNVFHQYGRCTPLIFAGIVKSKQFDEFFYYKKDDLGFQYTKEKTTFKLWAPTAYEVYIELEDKENTQMLLMEREAYGVYTIEVKKDLLGAAYLFYVKVNGEVNVCLDPYGKANTVNSKKSVVIDLDKINVEEYPLPKMDTYCDAVIYEVSIRDYTKKGRIKDFVSEKERSLWTYFNDLGITHLQFLPLMDFKSVDDLDVKHYYNWGYDPYQWMAFENSYSSNVNQPMKILENMKTLVETCHKHGIRINLDVVFNHVYEMSDSSLHLSVPYYYFQYHPQQGYSNATMCGNDVDSKRLMCRKLIVKSCEYLASKFKVDGLRFDLMGILDIDTLNEIVEVTQAINPNFMIYGEGWNMPSFLSENERATLYNNGQMPKVAHFSDRFREVTKGSTDHRDVHDLGYLLGNANKIDKFMNVLGGSTQNIGDSQLFINADQSVNYVECHDNMTTWDKIDIALDHSNRIKKLHHKMLIASVLLAQGIPFIHGGQEFCRSKQGLPNTYNAPDKINKIKWELAKENHEIVLYTKELIALRKEFMCLRQAVASSIHESVSYEILDGRITLYKIKDDREELYIFFNPTYHLYNYAVPKNYEMIFYNNRLAQAESPKSVDIHGLSVVIFKKKAHTI